MSILIELLAAALGLVGTLLLALRGPRAGWAFPVYLVSNGLWIWFATHFGHWGLVAQQVGFTITSLLGIYTWLIRPRFRAVELDWTLRDFEHERAEIAEALRGDLVEMVDTKVGQQYTCAPISADALHAVFMSGLAYGRQRVAEGR